jgi:hypothetical protein
MSPSAVAPVHVALKFSADLVERIESYREHMQDIFGGAIVITRVDAIRALVTRALDQFDADQIPATQIPATPVVADQKEEAGGPAVKKRGGRSKK